MEIVRFSDFSPSSQPTIALSEPSTHMELDSEDDSYVPFSGLCIRDFILNIISITVDVLIEVLGVAEAFIFLFGTYVKKATFYYSCLLLRLLVAGLVTSFISSVMHEHIRFGGDLSLPKEWVDAIR